MKNFLVGAAFNWKELGANALAGGINGAAFGGTAAVLGKIKDIYGPEIVDLPTLEIDADYPETEVQHYKPVIFDTTDSVDTEYYSIKCTSTRAVGYDNIYVSNKVKVKPKQLHYIDTRVQYAAHMIGAKSDYEMPRIIICDYTEIKDTAAATYMARDNTLCINIAASSRKDVLSLPKNVACADNHNCLFVHEMLHWYDAQRYRGKHGTMEGYMDANNIETKKHIEKLKSKGYNVDEISEYASINLGKNRYYEAWTEYRVKQILGGE